MQAKSWLRGLVGGLVALVLCEGCQSQVGEGYLGEPILTLQGSVELGEGATSDQVPVLAFPAADGKGYRLVDARVEGEYPAHFRLSVFDPPPTDVVTDANGTAIGFLTVVPKDHPSQVPDVVGVSNGALNDDGTATFERDACTADNICLHRVLSCMMHECPIIGETGKAIPADQVTEYQEAGEAGREHLVELEETCNAQHECHRVFRKCELPTSYVPDLLLTVPHHTATCSVTSESGDARVKTYEALLKSALGYSVVYAKQALPDAPGGPLTAGYNVFKTVEPETDQAWIDSIVCARDMPKSKTCPTGIHLERVAPEDQLRLRIGYRND
jgi:hypothetical protein